MSAAIVAGPDTGLVDLSRGGALLEVAARLSLGSAVRLKLTQSGRELAVVNGKVAWQKVASIASGQINYRVAVAFEEPLPEFAGTATDAPPPDQAPRTLSIVPARDNLTPFPAPAVQPKDQPAETTDAATGELRRKLEAATADLACQAAILESLAAKLKESEQQRAALAQQAADAGKKAEAISASAETRERKFAQAYRDQKDRYEALIAELVKSANEQQAEYQALLKQTTDAQTQQHAEDAEAARAQANARHRELEGRLEAAEMLCAAQQDRYRALRKETEKLMRMIDAASACGEDIETARVAS